MFYQQNNIVLILFYVNGPMHFYLGPIIIQKYAPQV